MNRYLEALKTYLTNYKDRLLDEEGNVREGQGVYFLATSVLVFTLFGYFLHLINFGPTAIMALLGVLYGMKKIGNN